MDDILYDKISRLNEDLNRKENRLLRNRMGVFRVVKKGKKYDEMLSIKNVIVTDEGSEIWI